MSLGGCVLAPRTIETTVTYTVTPPAPPAATTVVVTMTPLPPPKTPVSQGVSDSTVSVSDKVIVPNGVGKDYQSAQDLWRAAGLVVGIAHDATGAHRLPFIDSNWLVLSQDPPAGQKVDKGSLIVASVKKFTDK